MERYGLPKPDHRAARGAPDDLRRHPVPPRPRRDRAQAEHRAADRAHGRVRRRQRGRGRHRRLLHGLQGDVPVLRRRADRRARQRPAAVPARLPPGRSRTCSSSGCCSRSARSCRSPPPSRSGCATTSRAATRCPRRPRCAPTSRRERERMFKRYVASKRHTMQVDYDDYLADLAKERRRGAERARAQGTGCRCRRGRREARGMSAPAAGGASGPRPPTAPRSSPRRRDVFAEEGYGAVGVRDIIRRTDLASGTFYNYFPDKEAIFRALVEDTGAEARRRVRAARRQRQHGRGVRRGRLPGVLRVHRRGPGAVRVHAPQPRHAAHPVRRRRAARRAPASWPRTCAPRSPRATCRRWTSSTARTR